MSPTSAALPFAPAADSKNRKTETIPAQADGFAEMRAQLAALQAENERLKKQATRSSRISCKVSEKGALSVYGMGRFPVTLYAAQWQRLLAPEMVTSINSFIEENKAQLSWKEDATPVAK